MKMYNFEFLCSYQMQLVQARRIDCNASLGLLRVTEQESTVCIVANNRLLSMIVSPNSYTIIIHRNWFILNFLLINNLNYLITKEKKKNHH